MNNALLNCIRERLKQHRDNLALWKANILRPTVEDDQEQLAVMHDLCVAIAELETVLIEGAAAPSETASNKCSETERQTALLWAAEALVSSVLEHPLREEWTATGIEMKHFERLAVAVAALSPCCDGKGVTLDHAYIPPIYTNCKSCDGTGRIVRRGAF